MNGFDDSMDHGSNGTKPMQSTSRVTMSQTTAGASRQLTTPQVTQPAVATHTLHRTISRTPSAVELDEDPDSSFSETADRILSPRVNRIEELRSIYRQIRDEYEKTIKDVISYLSSTHEEDMALRQYLLHCELVLAKAKLNLDIAISYATTEYGRSNTTDIPRLAITKGWLEESLRRIDTDTPTLETDYGHLFSELSHYFLATIITQHQHTTFERRRLPTTREIADIFQRTEPRSYVPGVGPFLELATGLDTQDPLLMPEILRRLEARMITDTSLKDRDDPDANTTLMEEQSQLGHQSERIENTQAPSFALNEDGTVPEIDTNLDAPSPASVSSYETEMDMLSLIRQSTSDMEIDPMLDVSSSNSPAGHHEYEHEYQHEDRVEADAEPRQDRIPMVENPLSSCEPKLEDEGDIGPPDIVVGEQTEHIDARVEKLELRSPQVGEVPAQVKLDVEMDHQDGTIEHTAEPRPFYMIREEATGLDENDQRDLSAFSDFSTYDEVMQDVQEVEDHPDEQPNTSTMPTVFQTPIDPDLQGPAIPAPTPSRFHIHDSFVISDDEPEPDSNPYLTAYRAKKLASASASTSNTPASSAPVVCLSNVTRRAVPHASTPDTSASSASIVCPTDVTRRAAPRKSEPVVLISSPARPGSTQPPPASVLQRQSSRISDSMFISDDSDDDIPPSSNPHLAALIRAKASASAPASAPASGLSTPTSSASTSRSTRTKLPPHLARVRRAAHRQSLDPSSQVPTPEEKQLLDQEEYPLIDIIDEKTENGEKKYLIKWKPIHGRKFMNTWEPAENANAASVEDWELQKTRRDKRMGKGKVKKNRRGTGRERRGKSVREAAAAPASQRLLTQRQLAPSSSSSSSPADSPMFVVDTVGDTSLASRGTRFVSFLCTPSSSPADSSTDQVSSRTRSKVVTRDEPLDTPAETIPDLTPEPAFNESSGYAIQPFYINAVSPAPQPVPASSSGPNNSEKYKTPAQQKARMREKRAIRRAEKAEKLANMTEKQRAEHEHSKMMHKKAKRERKRTKAERWAAMSEEERQYWENWWDWKRTVRARTKEIKKERKAKKAKRRAKEARRMARREAHEAEEAS